MRQTTYTMISEAWEKIGARHGVKTWTERAIRDLALDHGIDILIRGGTVYELAGNGSKAMIGVANH